MSALRSLVEYARAHPIGRRDPVGTWRRIIAWQMRSRLTRGPHDVAWVNGARLEVARGMYGATGNLYFGLHEFAEMAFFAHLLRPGDVFVDIGTNVGTYTVLAARVCGADVHAFEPARETLPKLEANILLNAITDRVTVHPVALGEANGEASFTVGQDCVNRLADSANIADVTETVPLRRLDDELADVSPVAIKVDVEGGEFGVIAGAPHLLSSSMLCAIEIETLLPAVRQAIETAGFVERWYDPWTRRLHERPTTLPQHNHLFIRNEKFVRDRLDAGAAIEWAGQRI